MWINASAVQLELWTAEAINRVSSCCFCMIISALVTMYRYEEFGRRQSARANAPCSRIPLPPAAGATIPEGDLGLHRVSWFHFRVREAQEREEDAARK